MLHHRHHPIIPSRGHPSSRHPIIHDPSRQLKLKSRWAVISTKSTHATDDSARLVVPIALPLLSSTTVQWTPLLLASLCSLCSFFQKFRDRGLSSTIYIHVFSWNPRAHDRGEGFRGTQTTDPTCHSQDVSAHSTGVVPDWWYSP